MRPIVLTALQQAVKAPRVRVGPAQTNMGRLFFFPQKSFPLSHSEGEYFTRRNTRRSFSFLVRLSSASLLFPHKKEAGKVFKFEVILSRSS